MIDWTNRLQDYIVTSNNHLNNIIHNKVSTITNLKLNMDLNSIDSSLFNESKNNEYEGTIQNRRCLISFNDDFLNFDLLCK